MKAVQVICGISFAVWLTLATLLILEIIFSVPAIIIMVVSLLVAFGTSVYLVITGLIDYTRRPR